MTFDLFGCRSNSKYVIGNGGRVKEHRKGVVGYFQRAHWVLGQFDTNRQEAEKRYREFVEAGTREESIWEKVKGQALLGNEEFIERFEQHLQGKRDIGEIPRSQRYADRPSLEMLFRGIEDMEKRNLAIREAVGTHHYRQSEVAAYIGIHYSTVSKILSGEH